MAKVNTFLDVDADSDFSKKWRWLSKDATTGVSTPINLTGWTATMKITDHPEESGTVLVASLPVVLGGALGTISVTIPAATSAAWTFKQGFHRLTLYDALGGKLRFAEGRVRVS